MGSDVLDGKVGRIYLPKQVSASRRLCDDVLL